MTTAQKVSLVSLQEKVVERIEKLQNQAKNIYGKNVPNIKVSYDLKTVNLGGQAVFTGRQYTMRLHPAALVKYKEYYIDDTVVHEYAHLLQRVLYPMSKPHGREWKSVMRSLGANPQRCHKYDLSKALEEAGYSQSRKTKTYVYKCLCNEYKLSSIRHKRHESGERRYFCKKCKQTLELK